MAGRYRHGHHNKGMLQVHIIFVTRFRKDLLHGKISETCKQVLFDSAMRHQCTIKEMETDKDHVHMLIEYPPKLSISMIVKYLKQESTYDMWKIHGDILKRTYWYKNTLWSKGYFYCSVGEVSKETIARYIQNQG